MSHRRACSLLEILIALVLVAGPLLVALSSVQSSLAASRMTARHVALEALVSDLAEQLCTAAADQVAGLTPVEGRALLDKLIEEWVAAVPGDQQEEVRNQIISLIEGLTLQLRAQDDLPRFYQVEVVARTRQGGVVRAVRNVQLPPPPGAPDGPDPAS